MGSGGGRVVLLVACRVVGSGFEPGSIILLQNGDKSA